MVKEGDSEEEIWWKKEWERTFEEEEGGIYMNDSMRDCRLGDWQQAVGNYELKEEEIELLRKNVKKNKNVWPETKWR